ncbi:histidine ammonia-lyase-like [Daphnia pulex]|uniref:histidine ammonia-lyase-like n=1 Tax=Daphnia pulex TaxID=6669 RepID=UPI001EDDB05D|nr:histidine ammonia-lyase-like [Daphnia pulex]
MKISARVRGEWLQVPCKDGKVTVGWLAEEAVRRYVRLHPVSGNVLLPSSANNNKPRMVEVRKTGGCVLLDPEDNVCDVLDDNDFVNVRMENDVPDSIGTTTIGPPSVSHFDHTLSDPLVLSSSKIGASAHDQMSTTSDSDVVLDGYHLTIKQLVLLSKGNTKIRLRKIAEDRVIAGRQLVEAILKENKVAYGITTGFGKFARTVISPDKLEELQENLIRSHSAGVGQPLSLERVRMLMALRINTLAKGYSGISIKTLNQVINAFNRSCLPWVPEQGTVGASGDLAPLSHLALGMIGEGKMWSHRTGWTDAKLCLESNGLEPIKLGAKEGLALINGTQMITALGAEAVDRCELIAKQADVVAALSLEVLKGSSRAFDSDVHQLRPHPGQINVARRLRSLLHSEAYPSAIAESHRFCDRVQDAYTLRCCPQVHGIVHDTIDFVHNIIKTEMNSATDNPLVLPERGEIISAGNFHGEYPAKALDYLAIGVHELASMSERRIERLVNPVLSELPAFLVREGGLNSGFMIAHCTAASLVSENKVLCHPSSVDSLSTSAGTEDHVSMGGFSARKALQVVANVERVIAIELLAACQAIEFLRPLKTTVPLEEVYRTVRAVVRPWDKDRYMAPDIEAATNLLKDGKIWNCVKGYLDAVKDYLDLESRAPSPTCVSLPHSVAPPSYLIQEDDEDGDDPPIKKHCTDHHQHKKDIINE